MHNPFEAFLRLYQSCDEKPGFTLGRTRREKRMGGKGGRGGDLEDEGEKRVREERDREREKWGRENGPEDQNVGMYAGRRGGGRGEGSDTHLTVNVNFQRT